MMDLTDVHTEGAKEEYKKQVPNVANPILTMDTIYAQIEAAADSGLGIYGMKPRTPELRDPLVGLGDAAAAWGLRQFETHPGLHPAPLPSREK